MKIIATPGRIKDLIIICKLLFNSSGSTVGLSDSIDNAIYRDSTFIIAITIIDFLLSIVTTWCAHAHDLTRGLHERA